jgi:SAM-dependent methyltransferase
MSEGAGLPAAAGAFDSVAGDFDSRFGAWLSVAAQRRAVRAELATAFPGGSRLLEVGGGTGEDALWLAERRRAVLMTDASPAMVAIASAKFRGRSDLCAEIAPAEDLSRPVLLRQGPFDGAYSNFAALNCVAELGAFARGLASLVRPGGTAVLVVFGTFCPGEMIVELLRGRPRNALRRLRRGDVAARINGRDFTIRYHRAGEIACAMAPWFTLESRRGIGLCVPPSAAEPWISGHPLLLSRLESLDLRLATRWAGLADHILYRFRRTGEPA